MLKKLTLTYFRKHEDRTFDFSEGLNVFRAANESGKSSCLEAIAYTLFGAKALAEPLEKVVTWGHKPNELKVVLHFGEHVFSRSTRGAEVTLNGEVVCTGQNEVSAFAAALLGADMTMAANLMMASQGKLRGAIEGGAKATSTLIEDLSGLDLLDRILDAAAAKLALGSAAPYEARLESVEKYLGGLPALVAPDEDAFARQSEEFNRGLLDSEARVTELKVVRDAANSAVVDASAGEPGQPIDTGDLEKQIADFDAVVLRRAAYEKFLGVDQERARQHRPSVETWFSALKQARTNVTAKIRDLEIGVTRLKAQLVTAQTCSLCGLDVSQFPETAKKNAELQRQIAEKETELGVATNDLATAERDIRMLEAESNWEDALDRAARPLSQYLERDESVFPVLYRWKGETPAEVPAERPDLDGQLAAAKVHNAEVAKVRGRIEALRTVIARGTEQANKVRAEMDGVRAMNDADYDALTRRAAEANEAVGVEERRGLEFQMQLASLNTQHREAVNLYVQVEKQRICLSRASSQFDSGSSMRMSRSALARS